jgi:hypothetical protein
MMTLTLTFPSVSVAANSSSSATRIAGPSPTAAIATSTQVPEETTGRVIVKFKGPRTADKLNRVYTSADTSAGAVVVLNPENLAWRVPKGGRQADFAKKLLASGQIEYAVPDYIRQPLAYTPPLYVTPNDPGWTDAVTWSSGVGVYPLAKSWGLRDIGMPSAWQQGFTGPNVVGKHPLRSAGASFKVGVIDTGLYTTHEDIVGSNVVAGWDFFQSQNANGTLNEDADVTPLDPSLITDAGSADGSVTTASHGTICAGEIGATANNLKGSLGVGYDASVVAYKVMGVFTDGTSGMPDSAIIKAITRAADDGCKVISMSFGGTDNSVAIQNAIDYAYGKGCVLVAAKGNDGNAVPMYPGANNNVVSVGALSHTASAQDTPATFSSYYTTSLDIMAPGQVIWGPVKSDYNKYSVPGYHFWDGTSMATPLVAGSIAYLWRAAPALSNAQITSKVLGSARVKPATTNYPAGYRELDVNAAYNKLIADYPLLGNPTVSVAATTTSTSVPASWTSNPTTATAVTYDISLDSSIVATGSSATSMTLSAPIGAHTLKIVPHSSLNWEDGTEGRTVAFTVLAPPGPDTTPPVTTISGVSGSWVSTNVVFSLVASDVTSPVGISTYYGINAPAATLYSAPVTVSAEGTSTIAYYSVDASGNAETPKGATARIDKTAPSTTDDHAASYVGTATVKLTASDALSGVASTRYALDGTSSVGTSVTTTATGAHSLSYSSADIAGNREATHTVAFTVVPPDTTPPVTTISGVSGSWVSTNVVFSLVASDVTSPLGISTYYGLNAPAATLYSAPVTVSAEGTTTIAYYSTDSSGNAETPKSATARIDKTAPETTDDHVASYVGTATVKLTASDALSGVASTRYALDGIAGTGTSVTTTATGAHSLAYSSADVAGNREGTHTVTFDVVAPDMAPPNTTISGVSDSWVATDVLFSLTASDSQTPLGITTYYGLNEPATATYTAPVTVTAEGTTTIAYYSTDSSGNAETPKSATARIDKTAPETTDDHVASYVASAAIALSAEDTLSGVSQTDYVLDGTAGTGTSVTTTVTGAHSLAYSSADIAGNREATHTITFAVMAPPLPAPTRTALARPSFSPKTPRRRRPVTFTTYLSPGAAPADVRVKFYLYHWETKTVRRVVNGHARKVKVGYWRARGTLNGTRALGGLSIRLTAKARLPYAGRWRILARTTGTPAFSASTSTARLFSVK